MGKILVALVASFLVASCAAPAKLTNLSKSLAEGQAAITFWAELEGEKCVGVRVTTVNNRTGSNTFFTRHVVPANERTGRFQEIPTDRGQVFFKQIEPGKNRLGIECTAVNVGPTVNGKTAVETLVILYLPPEGGVITFDAKAGEITDLGIIDIVRTSDATCDKRCYRVVPRQSSPERLNALNERLATEGLKARLVQSSPFLTDS